MRRCEGEQGQGQGWQAPARVPKHQPRAGEHRGGFFSMQAWRMAAMWNMHVPAVGYTCRQARHANTASCWFSEVKYHRILVHCIHGTYVRRRAASCGSSCSQQTKHPRHCVRTASSWQWLRCAAASCPCFLRGCLSNKSPGSCCTI